MAHLKGPMALVRTDYNKEAPSTHVREASRTHVRGHPDSEFNGADQEHYCLT